MRVVTPVSPARPPAMCRPHVAQITAGEAGRPAVFELDDTPFRNKVEAAQIALERGDRLSNEQLDAAIAAAQRQPENRRWTARNTDKVTFDRYQKLSTLQNVSQADLDKSPTTGRAASSPSAHSGRNIHNLRIQRGERMSTAT